MPQETPAKHTRSEDHSDMLISCRDYYVAYLNGIGNLETASTADGELSFGASLAEGLLYRRVPQAVVRASQRGRLLNRHAVCAQ